MEVRKNSTSFLSRRTTTTTENCGKRKLKFKMRKEMITNKHQNVN